MIMDGLLNTVGTQGVTVGASLRGLSRHKTKLKRDTK